MSYREGHIGSGQKRPERHETDPPQVPGSAAEFWPVVIEHHLKRLLTVYRTDGMKMFRDAKALADILMLGVPGWSLASDELVLTVEEMEEQDRMDEKQAKKEEDQMNKQLMEAIASLMKQAQKPSQVTMNYPLIQAFNEITGNEKVNLRLPNNG